MLSKLLGRKRPEPIPTPVLEQTLRGAARKLPDLRWAAIVSVNGLVQEMYDPFGKTNRDRVAAMTSAALSLGERISHELRHGQLTYSAIASEEGLFIVHPLGEKYVLGISLPTETEIGTAINALRQVTTSLPSVSYPGME